MTAYLAGIMLGFSLIVAIGAQNAFVLKQGLRQQHIFIVCLICALSDALLIFIGVTGFNLLYTQITSIAPFARIAGAVFLFYYGAKSFWSAYHSTAVLKSSPDTTHTKRTIILTCLAFTWLNPHVYLDTVILLGSIASQYAPQEYYFAAGAITASFIFFFSLGYAARFLAPLFQQAVTWRILDIIIGGFMWLLCLKLINSNIY